MSRTSFEPKAKPTEGGNLHEPDLLYGAKAIADFLGLTEKQARNRIEAGVIPIFRMGGTICARRSTLTAWLTSLDDSSASGA